MRVCFLCRGFSSNGGIGRVIAILSNKLVDNLDVYLLSFYAEESSAFYSINPRCKQAILYSGRISMTKALVFGHAVNKLCKYIKENRINVIIACGALFYPLAVLAGKKAGIKSICWEHTNPNNNSDYKFQDIARKFGAKRSDLNIVLTKNALQVYQARFPKGKTVQVYNPIDPSLMKTEHEYDVTSKKIISVGRLRPVKNFSRLLDIAAVVLNDHPEWEWDIYGDGPLKMELEAKKEVLGLGRQVHFRGQVSDLYDRYPEYSFMVMTSDYEGFPMTLLEGSAHRLPMIAFDVATGPSEIIKNEKNGFLCKKGNESEMVRYIERLISDDHLRIRLSEGSRETITDFDVLSIKNKWVDFIENLAK